MSIVIPFSKTPPSAKGPSSPSTQVGPFELMAAAQTIQAKRQKEADGKATD